MMTRRTVLLSLLILLCASTSAATAEVIRGRVIDRDGRPVADAVVFVRDVPPAPAADTPATSVAVMDQVNKEFVPHVLPIAIGTAVKFPNNDQIHHHVYSFSRTKNFEIPLYKGEDAPPIVFDKEGAVKIGCNIHDWMSAVILVLPTQLFAKTGDDGTFRIDEVPPGRHTLATWHERSKTKLEDTAHEIDTGSAEETVLRLDVAPARSRSGVHGSRKYE